MFGAVSPSSGASAPNGSVLTNYAPSRDDESRLAATLTRTSGGADGGAAFSRSAAARARCIAHEIVRAIEARLPGRIRELKVVADTDQFTLRGISSSYYVKQVAGHLAMNALDARVLGRLSNEIEVRAAG